MSEVVPPIDTDLNIGLVIGSYEILSVLGVGGMGTVYLAEHTRLGRKVALKMLHDEFSHHPEAVRRFFSEARAVNRVSHENLVEITDFIDGDDGISCYIMEVLEGVDLLRLQTESTLCCRRVLDIAGQVASVLGAVHEAGIVHRDIKAENIFIISRHGNEDFVKLLDFGIAKLPHSEDSGDYAVKRTKAGTVLGTPTHIAPEQTRGPDVDGRADIYAFGVTLFELTTGQLPFDLESLGDLLVAHLTLQPPRPSEIPGCTQIPEQLETLITKCLAKNPDDRYHTMMEVGEELAAIAAALDAPLPSAALPEPLGGGTVIGIDLGTTNSCVAVLDDDRPVIIRNQEGQRTTPSMVSWHEDGEISVGASSRRQMASNPTRSLFGVKRLMGQKLRSPEIQEFSRNLPYQLSSSQNGDARVEIGDDVYSPQEVAAHIILKLVKAAEAHLGEPVREAVITVPAYFDEAQRQATKQAGTIAGLKVLALLNEATAAALAYGVRSQKNQKIVVFDMGGGTFDVSIVAYTNGEFDVLSTSGDVSLGGGDIDLCMLNNLADEFERSTRVDLREDPTALQRLKEAARTAKEELSFSTTTEVSLPFIGVAGSTPLHLTRTITRSELETCCSSVLERIEEPCRRALDAAKISVADIDHVLLVGGMTRMPAVLELATKIFEKTPTKGTNPDEAVASGAAIRAGMLAGGLQEITLLDITPFALGIRVTGDKMSTLIPANSKLPANAKKRFATIGDRQDFALVEVYQGESVVASNNRHLGSFRLGDLPGEQSRVTVAFTVDVDGILSVTATEPNSGRNESVIIEGGSGLSDDELRDIEVLRP